MIPEQRLSTTEVFADLELADPQPSDTVSRQYGGVALNDASQGLYAKVWTAEVFSVEDPLIPDDVLISSPDDPAIVLFSDLGISEISLAFDQNSHATVVYLTQGIPTLYWFDSVLGDFRKSTLLELTGQTGQTTPRCTLDDHRDLQNATSDIIITYIRDGNLYFLAQRDRFGIEYLLYADINLAIISPAIQYVAMNNVLRLQFSIRGNFYGG